MRGERRAYSRDDGTQSWEALEEIVGGLEGGSSVSFASGMAGIAAIFDQLHTGPAVALSDDCYQAVAGIAKAGQSRARWTMHRVAVADTSGWIEIETIRSSAECSVVFQLIERTKLGSPTDPFHGLQFDQSSVMNSKHIVSCCLREDRFYNSGAKNRSCTRLHPQ